jgi:hypothetical protein
MGPAYGTVFTRIDCLLEHGVELLSQSDMFAAEPRGRVIRRDSMPNPEDHEIKRFQVLVAGAGTLGDNELYGRALIADARLAGKYVGPDSMTLVFREPESDQSLFTYAYLATSVGVAAIRATSYGTKILRFREDLLSSLPVPIADPVVVYGVAVLVRRCVEQREIFLRELHAARETIERMPDMREAHAMCAARGPKRVVWAGSLPTLRAWNFASTGDALSYLRKRWTGCLADAVESEGIFKGGRLTRVPCDPPHGVNLLSQRDVFAIRPVPRRVQRPTDSLFEVTPSMLLLASRGQMSEGAIFARIERASHMPAGAIVTEDITRIRPRDGLGEGLYAFLSTSVGQSLLRSTAYGTSIPGMRGDLLARLPLPETGSLQRATKHVEAATAARIAAAQAESEAISTVEEEVLPAWLA